MKSPCYLVTLSLESSDFQTFLKQYVISVPFWRFDLHWEKGKKMSYLNSVTEFIYSEINPTEELLDIVFFPILKVKF